MIAWWEMRVAITRYVFLVGLAACHAHVPAVPGQGGPAWREVTSPHFTVWTDADLNDARAVVTRMERMRAVLAYAAFPSAPAAGRGLAIVLRGDGELRAFSPTDEVRPFAAEVEAPLWQPLIVLSASSQRAELERTLAHELTHAISFGVVHSQPRWFSEGMATYFQSAGLDPRKPIVEIGGSPTGGQIDVHRVQPIRDLFGWTQMTRDEGDKYLTAWALFFFLSNQHADELQRFAHLLDVAGPAVVHDAALVERLWDQAFTRVPFAQVDGALTQWLFTGSSYTVQRFRVDVGDLAITERPLGDGDVYAIRALLRHLAHRPAAEVHADLTSALAQNNTQILARVMAYALDHAGFTPDLARSIRDDNKDDWRAWLLLADVLASSDPAGADAARARACGLVANNPALSPPPKLCPPGLVGHSAADSE